MLLGLCRGVSGDWCEARAAGVAFTSWTETGCLASWVPITVSGSFLTQPGSCTQGTAVAHGPQPVPQAVLYVVSLFPHQPVASKGTTRLDLPWQRNGPLAEYAPHGIVGPQPAALASQLVGSPGRKMASLLQAVYLKPALANSLPHPQKLL